MLVLSRKTQERIQIGENVVVTVLRVKGNMVRIGIEAPRDVRVMRAELPCHATSDAEQRVLTNCNQSDMDSLLEEPQVTIEKPGSSLRKLAEAVLARRNEAPKPAAEGNTEYVVLEQDVELSEEMLVA